MSIFSNVSIRFAKFSSHFLTQFSANLRASAFFKYLSDSSSISRRVVLKLLLIIIIIIQSTIFSSSNAGFSPFFSFLILVSVSKEINRKMAKKEHLYALHSPFAFILIYVEIFFPVSFNVQRSLYAHSLAAFAVHISQTIHIDVPNE